MTITRKSQDLIVIKCRKCSLTYGVSPCTASGAIGDECYNTRKTCQDLPNYTETTQDINLVDASETLPEISGVLFPTLTGISYKAIEVNPGALSKKVSALGKTGELGVTLTDHVHHDRGIDPYYATRPAEPQGTFWARWLKRNYYQGMELERYRIIDNVVSTEKQLFYIKDISTSDGAISIRSEDIIRKLSETLIPAVSTGVLSTDITDSQTIFNVVGGDYPSSGTIVLGNELMTFTRVGEVFTVVRGEEPKSYKQGDTVQLALVYENQRVDDTLYDLTVNQAGADPALINFSDWQDEVTSFLPTARLTNTIAKPTQFKKIASEISEQTLADFYFGQEDQKIILSAYKPGITVKSLDDDSNFTDAGIPIQRDDDTRINLITVRYGKRNPLDSDEAENYSRVEKIFAPVEVIARYDGVIKEKEIFASWLDEDQKSQAYSMGTLILGEGEEERQTLGFELEYKDSDLNVKDVVAITHRELVDNSGAPETINAIVVSKKEVEVGLRWQYKAIISDYANIQFGYIAPLPDDDEYNGEWNYDLLDNYSNLDLMTGSNDFDLIYGPEYDWQWLTETLKNTYVWLSDGSNNFYDGREPYQLV